MGREDGLVVNQARRDIHDIVDILGAALGLVKNIVVGTIPGLVVAGATFYFFTATPRNPIEGLSVLKQEQMVPTDLFGRIAGKVQPKGFDPREVFDKFTDVFDQKVYATLLTYEIKNDTSKEIKALTVEFKSFLSAEVEDDDGQRPAVNDAKSMSLRLLPGGDAQVSILYTGSRLGDEERFLLDGQAVPIKALDERQYQPPLSIWMSDHPDLAFALWALASLIISVTVLNVGVLAFVRQRPDLWAQTVDSKRLVEALTAINYLKIENPKKFQRIVSRSEKMFKFWSDKQDTHPPGSS